MEIVVSFLEFRGSQENVKPAAGTSLDIRRARLVIGRVGERDAMTLKCEVAANLADAVGATLLIQPIRQRRSRPPPSALLGGTGCQVCSCYGNARWPYKPRSQGTVASLGSEP